MFPYTLRITPRGWFAIMILPGKMAPDRQYSSPDLEEKISREAMDSMLRKLSMIVDTAKSACNKPSWVWFFDNINYSWPGVREIAIRRL